MARSRAPILGLIILAGLVNRSVAKCTFYGGHTWSHSEKFSCRVENVGECIFQSDGNLVIYDAFGTPKWASNTRGVGYRLDFQKDGNLVIYNRVGEPIWSSGTEGRGFRLEFQEDRNIVIYDTNSRSIWRSDP